MPRPGLWRSPACDAFVARVAGALKEERASIASLLEDRHTKILKEIASQICTQGLGASAIFPDSGPDIALRESATSSYLKEPCVSDHMQKLKAAPALVEQVYKLREDPVISDVFSKSERLQSVHGASIALHNSVMDTAPPETQDEQPRDSGYFEISGIASRTERMQTSGTASGSERIQSMNENSSARHTSAMDTTASHMQAEQLHAIVSHKESALSDERLTDRGSNIHEAPSVSDVHSMLAFASSVRASRAVRASLSSTKEGRRKKQKRPLHFKDKRTGVLIGGSTIPRDLIIRRLHAKLGFLSPTELLHADDLHAALESLTMSSFDYDLVKELMLHLRAATLQPDASVGSSDRGSGLAKALGMGDAIKPLKKLKTRLRLMPEKKSEDRSGTFFWKLDCSLPFEDFLEVMLMDANELITLLGDRDEKDKVILVRDVLLSSDANCLVAELMNLRVDDLAAPKPPVNLVDIIEPMIALVIILNALLIGLQTVPVIADHPATVVFDVSITLLFVFEFAVKVRHAGLHKHLCGPDWNWNWFDLTIIVLALIDIVLALLLVAAFDPSALTIVRMARLVRLARVARIFRLSWLSELNLVVKGLIGGLRTLFWAVVLLFFIIYVVAVFLTTAIGPRDANDDIEFEALRETHFSTLPRSAFTTFRCLLIVDCAGEGGRPLLTLATNRFGWYVPVVYMFLFVTVSIGLMNVIMAIYIESTLREAKKTEEGNKEMRHKQSMRVAVKLKRLLIKFSRLQAAYKRGLTEEEMVDLMSHPGKAGMRMFRESCDEQLPITKEVFMMAIQDPEAQQIMNELDIPPERAQLFDALDAEGTGELRPTDLLNGLLKVRGETRKSDTAALLLAVRSIRTQLHLLDTRLKTQGQVQDHIVEVLNRPLQGQVGKTIQFKNRPLKSTPC